MPIIAKQIQRTGQRVALTGHIMDTFGATACPSTSLNSKNDWNNCWSQ